jgi:hypothetical protein
MLDIALIIGLLIGLVVLVGAVLRWDEQRNQKALQRALADYEGIVSDQLWKGSEAEVFASERKYNPRVSGSVCYEYVCRTKNGAWFVLRVAVFHGSIVERSLTPCNEMEARRRLEPHPEAYVRCFGQPRIA